MILPLAVLGVAFAGFCVWLTVRIVNRREKWAKWTAVGLVVAMFVLYPLSYPWAQAAMIGAEMNAAKRGEQLPNWIDEAATAFYKPLGWGIAVMPAFVLKPYRSYNEWSLKMSGVDFEHFIQ